mgnify:CR=1 FL=1|jgi:phosphoglycolate phosphatase-like HAD superfamily hydrolase|tara:strand:- start:6275 stop:6727 length:453 start_codon:yes stop_codon:yes gene_type:complete
MQTVIFDIDGTIANIGHRLHHITEKPKDWPAFKAALVDDVPIPEIVWLVQVLNFHKNMDNVEIVFCSGRNMDSYDDTVKWIRKYVGIQKPTLFMRAEKDYRDDVIVKRELLAEMRTLGYDPFLVFDDRQRVVDMWREEGLMCCQVAKGDY